MSEHYYRITVECAACAFRYDGTRGLFCPYCACRAARWAERQSAREAFDGFKQHFPFSNTQDERLDKLREGLSRADWDKQLLEEEGVTHNPKDLAVLEHIWGLTEYDPTK